MSRVSYFVFANSSPYPEFSKMYFNLFRFIISISKCYIKAAVWAEAICKSSLYYIGLIV